MLEAVKARKTYGDVVALEGLDLSVGAGDAVCLLGANGAGKSTTTNLFLGFIAPDTGSVRVGGVSPTQEPEAARHQIAYIPENVALYPALSGRENLCYLDELCGHQRDEVFLVAQLEEAA
ncbi:MAG: ATP-binding cassette domain-containing protein [Halieaceae bacterium]|jgi:ABC-2 type transport system ATP-binding protein|nr:ATP-binding cassette domain-containing protein [Halieaceae bacterium]